ncbi:hypothetical protein BZA77DRAFT_348320 [Pyronema omphalodes]|nr:hypothetical protein BZA77DRAFT_348320 [Pyronema omphalodes]
MDSSNIPRLNNPLPETIKDITCSSSKNSTYQTQSSIDSQCLAYISDNLAEISKASLQTPTKPVEKASKIPKKARPSGLQNSLLWIQQQAVSRGTLDLEPYLPLVHKAVPGITQEKIDRLFGSVSFCANEEGVDIRNSKIYKPGDMSFYAICIIDKIVDDVFGEELEGLAGADYSEKLRVARELINTLYMHSIPPPISRKFKPRMDPVLDDRSRKILRFASPISTIRQISPPPSLTLDTDLIWVSNAPIHSSAIAPTGSIKYAFSKAHRISHAEPRADKLQTHRLPTELPSNECSRL